MKSYKVLSRKDIITKGDFGIWKRNRGEYPKPLIWADGAWWYGRKVGELLDVGAIKEVRRPIMLMKPRKHAYNKRIKQGSKRPHAKRTS